MDETIIKWVIEFLIHQRIDDTIINGLISSLPPVNDDYRFKKTMILRRIEIETLNGCISEKILELIEIIEELDHEKGKTASNLMKNAYCLVAVDCTVRFLVENVEENAKYTEIVDNLWRNRVCKSKGLSSDVSKRWFSDIEVAVENSEVFEKIWRINTRNEALKAVRMYLKETWESLGPSFLESMAVKWRNESEELYSGGGGGVVCSDSEKDHASIRRKHAALKGRGANISDADEDFMNKTGDDTTEMAGVESATPKMNGAKKETRSNTRKRPLVNHLSEDVQTARTFSSTGPTGENGAVEADQIRPKRLERCKLVRVQRAMRSKTRELNAAVRDPFPQAERLLKIQVCEQNTETDMSNDAGVSKQGGKEMDAPKGSNETDPENLNQDTRNGNSLGYAILDHGTHKIVRKRSLMELNDTSHTLEWDDEMENVNLASTSRPRLLNTEATRSFSSLQLPKYKNIQRRRERKRWAPLEEETLREGVLKYGRSWKSILSDDKFAQVFQGRTEVDLKDKWRNLLK